MKKIIITEAHVKEMTEWAGELASDMRGRESTPYDCIMEGIRIALLTLAENHSEAEFLLKEWWE